MFEPSAGPQYTQTSKTEPVACTVALKMAVLGVGAVAPVFVTPNVPPTRGTGTTLRPDMWKVLAPTAGVIVKVVFDAAASKQQEIRLPLFRPKQS